MLRRYPPLFRFLSKLFYELLPAAVASAVGGMLFNHYARPAVATPATAIQTPASTEMMQMVRQDHAFVLDTMKKYAEAQQQAEHTAEQEARIRTAERAAMLAAREAKAAETRALAIAHRAAQSSGKRLAARQPVQSSDNAAATARPGPPASAAPQTQPAVEPAAAMPASATSTVAGGENPIMAKLRNVTATVERFPLWVRSVAGWFNDDAPPRPPLELPARNFLKAEM